MTDTARYHFDKLAGVHPMLAEKVRKVCYAMAMLGFEMIVTGGLRTTAQQQALYAKGRTAPGEIVTNADGVTHTSNHQAKVDGYGHAVDCAFMVDGKASWAESNPWALYGAMATALGLRWGGDWSAIVDRPHVEMPS